MLSVAAAHGTRSNVWVAGLVAGAMAMAAGEYVSVHSQADNEQTELKRERSELKADDKGEHEELTAIYVARGLDPSLAKQVADQLMAHRRRFHGAFALYQRPQGLTVAQVLDVIEATRSGSSAKKRQAAQDLSTMSS